jgi:hypothetical protein
VIRVRAAHLLLAVLSIACESKRTPGTERAPGAARIGQPVSAAGNSPQVGVCATPSGGLRLGLDTIAGMPAALPVRALRAFCAAARVDSVVYAGFASPALRFDYSGATIWAVQNVPDTDTLVPGQSVESWVGVGDSLRFADGRLIPRQLGQIRAMESLGIMFLNSGDDSEGADVALCHVRGLSFFFDTLPAPADTRVRAFAGIRATETLLYRRVEQRRDSVVLNTTQRACQRVGVT